MESKELTVVERAAVALGTARHEKDLVELVRKSESITTIKNVAGREQCHGALMTLKNARVSIEKAGKAAREDATQFSKAVIAEEKRLVAIAQPEETRLQEIRDEWDEARAAEKREKEEAETRRVAAIRVRIEAFMLEAMNVARGTSAEINLHATLLEAMEISIEDFAELAGEAQAKLDSTVRWLRERQVDAETREAEAARIVAEREELARLRAQDEERRRVEAAERAAQEARDRAARAEQEARDRAVREAEEAKRREEQAAAEAKLRAERAEHEKRMAAEREEVERRRADLDRVERENREREEKALREMAEAQAKAERDKEAQQRAENRAAMLAPEITGGTWSIGKTGGCVVTDAPIPGAVGSGHADVEYYGGNLIAESIYRPSDARLIAAAPDLFAALKAMVNKATKQDWNEAYPEQLAQALAAIDKATIEEVSA